MYTNELRCQNLSLLLVNPHQSKCHASTEQKQQKIQATQNAKGGGAGGGGDSGFHLFLFLSYDKMSHDPEAKMPN